MQELTQTPRRSANVVLSRPPLTSIVIVCYNQAHFLRQAVQSALDQTHENLEVIVVDDGSTDDTAAVCAGFPQVRYLYQNNQGLAAARNTGLRHCTGDSVVFLDADDLLLRDAIQNGLDCLRGSPECAFAFGGYRNIFSDGSPAPTLRQDPVGGDIYARLLESNFIGMHGAVLYRKKVLSDAGGFNESLRACEDYELYLRLARQYPACSHNAVVAEYRQHDENMSKDYAFMLRSVLKVLGMERKHLRGSRQRKALRSGFRVWRAYYGDLLLEEWKEKRGRRRLLEVFRLWPEGVLRQAGLSLSRRFRQLESAPFGNLRRLSPFSREFGFDRGQPIDRYYVESYLKEEAPRIRGRVLEIGNDSYSRQFGAPNITHQDVLHVVAGFPGATIIADLADAPHIPSETFDCIILTQTLHYIFDLHAAVDTLRRILRTGGVLLVTLPGISQISRDQQDRESDCWRFTQASATRLFSRCFGETHIRVQTYGNVLTAISFLEGLTVTDLRKHELEYHDPDYQVTIAVTAIKAI